MSIDEGLENQENPQQEKKFKQWDEDGDGKISFEELKVLSVSEASAYLYSW